MQIQYVYTDTRLLNTAPKKKKKCALFCHTLTTYDIKEIKTSARWFAIHLLHTNIKEIKTSAKKGRKFSKSLPSCHTPE